MLELNQLYFMLCCILAAPWDLPNISTNAIVIEFLVYYLLLPATLMIVQYYVLVTAG